GMSGTDSVARRRFMQPWDSSSGGKSTAPVKGGGASGREPVDSALDLRDAAVRHLDLYLVGLAVALRPVDHRAPARRGQAFTVLIWRTPAREDVLIGGGPDQRGRLGIARQPLRAQAPRRPASAAARADHAQHLASEH